MQERPFSNEELRLGELLHEFLDLSNDQDYVGRITLRGPGGEFIGEARLSLKDIKAATSALASLNACRDAMEESTEDDALLAVDQEDSNQLVSEVEKFLAEGGV